MEIKDEDVLAYMDIVRERGKNFLKEAAKTMKRKDLLPVVASLSKEDVDMVADATGRRMEKFIDEMEQFENKLVDFLIAESKGLSDNFLAYLVLIAQLYEVLEEIAEAYSLDVGVLMDLSFKYLDTRFAMELVGAIEEVVGSGRVH